MKVFKGVINILKSLRELMGESSFLLLKIYFVLILVFWIFRLALGLSELEMLSNMNFWTLCGTFYYGIPFDSQAIAYILLIPFLLLSLTDIINLPKKFTAVLIKVYLSISVIIIVAIASTDIPFFDYYDLRISSAVLNWISTPDIMFSFIFGSVEYYIFIAVFIGLSVLLIKLINNFSNDYIKANLQRKLSVQEIIKRVSIRLLILLIIITGMRGKLYSDLPLKWSDACNSNNTFANQMTLNPVFTLTRSLIDESKYSKISNKTDYINENDALEFSKEFFGINENNCEYSVLRNIKPNGKQIKPNIVLIMMESMSKGYMGCSGFYTPSLTPFLDELTNKSLFFNNFFGDGNHTINGVWAVTTSLPSFPEERNPLDKPEAQQSFSGIGNVLIKNGYNTYISLPHDPHFDNMSGFLYNNGFQEVHGYSKLLNDDMINPWGISDHVHFEYFTNKLDQLQNSQNPFFATILSISNHGPYVLPANIPNDFKPNYEDKKLRAVEYADWSIKHFFDINKNKPWFDNTIFILVADHGKNVKPNYEVNLFYHRIPCMFYSPKYIKPMINSNYAMQIDIFPTLMGILNLPYQNNTLGVNIMENKRDFVYFHAGNRMSILDSNINVIKSNNVISVFDYKTYSTVNEYQNKKKAADLLLNKANSFYQTEKYMMRTRKTGLSPVITHNAANR